MRRERFNLEDQVGGLIDHDGDRPRHRRAPHVPEPERYELTAPSRPAIRAARAAEEEPRRVA